jgi:hypothetical protein
MVARAIAFPASEQASLVTGVIRSTEPHSLDRPIVRSSDSTSRRRSGVFDDGGSATYSDLPPDTYNCSGDRMRTS